MKMDDAIEDYRNSLADLTQNSKPLINMLTMLAEDNETHAARIVEAIETHLQQVDEKTRQCMFKVRQTWNQHFPARKLYALDVRVNNIDHAWPLTSAPPASSSIHVNPRFLAQKEDSLPLPDVAPVEDEDEAEMRRQLIAKQAELLKLQQKRLELELRETEARLSQSKKTTTDVFVGVEDPETKVQPPISRDPRLASRDPRLRDPRVVRDPRTQSKPAQSELLPSSQSQPTLTFFGSSDNIPLNEFAPQHSEPPTLGEPMMPPVLGNPMPLAGRDAFMPPVVTPQSVAHSVGMLPHPMPTGSLLPHPMPSGTLPKPLPTAALPHPMPSAPPMTLAAANQNNQAIPNMKEEPMDHKPSTPKKDQKSKAPAIRKEKFSPDFHSALKGKVTKTEQASPAKKKKSDPRKTVSETKTKSPPETKDVKSSSSHHEKSSSHEKTKPKVKDEYDHGKMKKEEEKDHGRNHTRNKRTRGDSENEDRRKSEERSSGKGYDSRSRRSKSPRPRSRSPVKGKNSKNNRDSKPRNKAENKRDSKTDSKRPVEEVKDEPKTDSRPPISSLPRIPKRATADIDEREKDRDDRRLSGQNKRDLDDRQDRRGKKPRMSAERAPLQVETKMNEDISDLFGCEDQDYRHPDIISPRGSGQVGWAQYKADHPKDFDSRPTIMGDVDHRRDPSHAVPLDSDYRSGPYGRPQMTEPGYSGPLWPGPPYEPVVPEQLRIENREQILRKMEMRRKSGEISHEELQTVLTSLNEYDNMVKQKQYGQSQPEPPLLKPELHHREIPYHPPRPAEQPREYSSPRRSRPNEPLLEYHSPRKDRSFEGRNFPIDAPRDFDQRESIRPPIRPEDENKPPHIRQVDFDAPLKPSLLGPGPGARPLIPVQDAAANFDVDHRQKIERAPIEQKIPDVEPGRSPIDRPVEEKPSLLGPGPSPAQVNEDVPKKENDVVKEEKKPASKKKPQGLAIGAMLEMLRAEGTPENSQDGMSPKSNVEDKPSEKSNGSAVQEKDKDLRSERGPTPTDKDRRGTSDKGQSSDRDRRDRDRKGPHSDRDRRDKDRRDRRGPPGDKDRRGPHEDRDRRGPFNDRDRRGPNIEDRPGSDRDKDRRPPLIEDRDRRGPPRSDRDRRPPLLDDRVPKLLPKPMYNPDMDDRWMMLGGVRMKDGALNIFPEGTEEIVIDRTPFPVKLGGPKQFVFYNGEKLELFIDPTRRMVHINGTAVYKISDPVKEVAWGPAPHQRAPVFYHGKPRNMWIDGNIYNLRIDAPPKIIKFRDRNLTVMIDGRDGMLLIDKKEFGTYGGKPRFVVLDGERVELRFTPPPRNIVIDGEQCLIRLDRKIPFIVMNDVARGIRFNGPPRDIIINGQKFMVPTDRAVEICVDGQFHMVALGGPLHELIIDGVWYEFQFNGPPKEITVGNHKLLIMLPLPPPEVKILDPLENQKLKDPEIDTSKDKKDKKPISIFDLDVPKPANMRDNRVGSPLGDSSHSHRDSPVMKEPFNGPPGQFPPRPNQPFPPNQPLLGPGSNPRPPFMDGPNRFPGGPNQPPFMQGPNQPMFQPGPNQPFPPGPNQQPMPFPGPRPPMSHEDGSQGPHPMFQSSQNQPFPPQSQGQPLPSMPAMSQPMSTQQSLLGLPGQPLIQPVVSQPLIPGLMTSQEQGMPSLLPPPQPPTLQPEPLNVESLLQKLINAGLINKAKEEKKEEKTESENESQKKTETPGPKSKKKAKREKLAKPEKIPDLTDMKMDVLKQQYIGVIQRMYSGIQCTSCGTRFMASQTSLYREHLDWHFRQNQREKRGAKISRHRTWFYEINDWLEYEDVGDSEERARTNLFEQQSQERAEKEPQEEKVQHCPAATDEDAENVCVVCGDEFEQFFDEESETWHLKNALRVNDKTYHPVCYEDEKETPKEDPGANPMMLQIQKELGYVPADTVVSFPAANVISVSQVDHTPKDIEPETPVITEENSDVKPEAAPS